MAWLLSLLVGISVGAAYALIGVKSPAPPLVALVGLLGIVIGEQGVPWIKAQWADRPAITSAPNPPDQHIDPP